MNTSAMPERDANRTEAPTTPGAALDEPAFVHPEVEREAPAIHIERFSLWYGDTQALHAVTLPVAAGKVAALIGPSGCGKSTLLRSINRMNDLVDGVRVEGDIRLHESSVFGRGVDVIALRKRMGMVFQKSNPFPKSIYDNVAYAPRLWGERNRAALDDTVERCLDSAALWDEVKDRLHTSALALSGGQQQRLCIARALAADPEVLLMDEPCSALDPIATARIEELINSLRGRYTILIVTHNMQQAARVSDYTAFLYLGRLVEYGPTQSIFVKPARKQTEDYVTGRFG